MDGVLAKCQRVLALNVRRQISYSDNMPTFHYFDSNKIVFFWTFLKYFAPA